MRRIALALMLGAGLVLAAPAGAATFTVDSADDEADSAIDGTCDSAPGAGVECTLRAALQEANDTGAPDVIVLPRLQDPYQLTLGGPGEDAAAGGDLDVTEALTLQGSGQPLIDALGSDRVLHLGPSGSPAVTVSGVELRGGGAVPAGAGVLVEAGTLSLRSSTVAGNAAVAAGAGEGGGVSIASPGAHSIVSSTISANVVEGGTSAFGGGIAVTDPAADLALTNTTVSGNEAKGAASPAYGGGISAIGDLSLTHTTVHQNAATGAAAWGGSLFALGAPVRLRATIVSAGVGVPLAENCYEALGGRFQSDGSNVEAPAIEASSQCGLALASADRFTGSAELAPLAYRGGPTETHALLTTSVALDAAPFCFPLTSDQRGETRPSGSACDAGSFERQVTATPGSACFGRQPTIIGTAKSERLVGTPEADVIVGEAGDDLIKARGGADRICAGKGSDRAYGGAGDDRIAGEDGKDRLFGQAGRDLLLGNAARDLLNGGKGRDSLNGGGHRDRCLGGRDKRRNC